jgi:hypothetical protein
MAYGSNFLKTCKVCSMEYEGKLFVILLQTFSPAIIEAK